MPLKARYFSGQRPIQQLRTDSKAIKPKLPTSAVVVGSSSFPQSDHNILFVQIPFVSSINLNRMMAQHSLDFPTLNGYPSFPHYLCALPDPNDHDEFYAGRFGVVCIFYPRVCILRSVSRDAFCELQNIPGLVKGRASLPARSTHQYLLMRGSAYRRQLRHTI